MGKFLIFTITSIAALLGLTWNSLPTGQLPDSKRETAVSNSRPPFSIVNDVRPFGIEVVGPSDKTFEEELGRFSEVDRNVRAKVEESHHLAFFIRNRSTDEIVGISLRWKLVDSNGGIRIVPMTRTHPGVLMGMKPDASMVGKTSIINPGGVQFFSYASNGTSVGPSGGSKGKEFDGVESIAVSIDGVFFSDGSFAGEDLGFYFEEVSGLVAARLNFIKELSAARASGLTPTDSLERAESLSGERRAPPVDVYQGKRFESRDKAYDTFYVEALDGLIKQVHSLRRASWSDERIITSFLSAKVDDFKTLKRRPVR